MSSKPDDLDLEVIHQLANRNQKVQDLIKDKNKEIYNIDRSQSATYKKIDPAPKPKGDIRFTKTFKIVTDKEILDNRKNEVKERYNKEIKQEMIDSAKNKGLEEINQNQIKDMPHQDLAILSEKGVEAYKQHEKQQALEKEQDGKEKLPTQMTDKEEREFYGDYDEKQETIFKETDKGKDLNQEVDIEQQLKMDEKESEKLLEETTMLEDFKDNSKDIEIDKRPLPSDDFE